MTDIAQPHDRFLKALLANPETAGTLLREWLPGEIAQCLAPEPLEAVDGSFVDETLRAHLTDCLYRARTLSGRMALLYLLVEHKSLPDGHVAWQLLRYLVRILEQWERENPDWRLLPAVVPLVFYHGEGVWRVPDEFLALVDAEEGWRPYLLNFRYTLFDLGQKEDRAISRSPRLRAWLVAAKYATRAGMQLQAVELLAEVLTDAGDDFPVIMRYIVETYHLYDETTVREIIRRVRPEEEAMMMSKFARDEFAKGEAKGHQAAVAILLGVIEDRFGSVPDWVREQVQEADFPTLQAWSRRVYSSQTLQALFQ